MAGHSHWAGIKHKKAIIDAKRGKLFSKLARRIIVAAKTGGGDPNMNLALKYAIDDAKKSNMPGDNIDRAVKKGSGDLDGANYQEIVYEGYGPSGVAVLLHVLTDNRNRTVGELRRIFDRKGGNLGASGCVAWMFDARGVLSFPAESVAEETLLEAALEAGADDVAAEGDMRLVLCDPKNLEAVRSALTEAGHEPDTVEVRQIPQTMVELEAESARKVLELCEELDEQDDVQNVYANFDIPEDVLRLIEAEG